MFLIHPDAKDLFIVIRKRRNAATRVLFIGTELTSCLSNGIKGKEMWDDYTLGRVGVFDKNISLQDLEEDIAATKEIIKI